MMMIDGNDDDEAPALLTYLAKHTIALFTFTAEAELQAQRASVKRKATTNKRVPADNEIIDIEEEAVDETMKRFCSEKRTSTSKGM
jgi:hypothetical protein